MCTLERLTEEQLMVILVLLSEEQRRKFDRIYPLRRDAYDLCERALKSKFPVRVKFVDTGEEIDIPSSDQIPIDRDFTVIAYRQS